VPIKSRTVRPVNTATNMAAIRAAQRMALFILPPRLRRISQ
jgi:hypothetical protein